MTKCAKCQFAIKNKIGDGLTCHRRAPSPEVMEGRIRTCITVWPPVPPEECCGEGLERGWTANIEANTISFPTTPVAPGMVLAPYKPKVEVIQPDPKVSPSTTTTVVAEPKARRGRPKKEE